MSEFKLISFKELMAMDFGPQYKSDRVSLDKENLVINIQHDEYGHIYEVDLERITEARQALDWIYQLHGKGWMTPEMMHDFLECLDHACGSVQGALCHSRKKLKWRKGKGR